MFTNHIIGIIYLISKTISDSLLVVWRWPMF